MRSPPNETKNCYFFFRRGCWISQSPYVLILNLKVDIDWSRVFTDQEFFIGQLCNFVGKNLKGFLPFKYMFNLKVLLQVYVVRRRRKKLLEIHLNEGTYLAQWKHTFERYRKFVLLTKTFPKMTSV